MLKSRNITDLKSLQAAKVELEQEIIAREFNIKIQYAEIKDSIFNLSYLKTEGVAAFKGFLSENFGLISAAVSGFIVNKVIRPKNKWIRKLSTAGISLLVKKYSGIIEKNIRTLLQH